MQRFAEGALWQHCVQCTQEHFLDLYKDHTTLALPHEQPIRWRHVLAVRFDHKDLPDRPMNLLAG